MSLLCMFATACDNGSSGGGGDGKQPTPPAQLEGEINVTKLGNILYADYTGGEEVAYQWQVLEGEEFHNINDETDENFEPNAAGTYRVIVSAEGYDSKASASVTMSPLPALTAPSITHETFLVEPTKVYVGDTLQAIGEAGVTYQWNSADESIVDATTQSFTPTTAGIYTVTISKSGYISATSASQSVEVRPLLGALEIQPSASDRFVIGSDIYTGATLNAIYTPVASEVVTYAWSLEGGVAVSTDESIMTGSAGRYTVTISSDRRAPKSVSLTVSDDPLAWFEGDLTITPSPDPLAALVGDTITATYDGSETDITYEWRSANNDLVASGNTYPDAAEGEYTVSVIKAGYHDLKGQIAVNPLPSISKPALPSDIVVGTELVATNTDINDIAYQWYRDGEAIVDATSDRYTPTLVGYYYVALSAPRMIATTSDEVTARLTAGDLRPLLPGNISINEADYAKGTNGILTVDYVGDAEVAAALTYTWTKDGDSANILGTTKSYTPPESGVIATYTVAVGGMEYSPRTISTYVGGWKASTALAVEVMSIAYGAEDGIYVAVGRDGNMAWSTDLNTWTAVTPLGTSIIWDITYGNGVFVGINHANGTPGGGVVRSEDGKNWVIVEGTTGLIAIRGALSARLLFVDGIFVLNDGSGYIRYSADGITWTQIKNNIYGMNYINDRLYVVTGAITCTATNCGNISYTTDVIGNVYTP
ncbi:MAG: hypothetical protein LBV09_03390, partial [Deferribacteraceae bacterium]|nr:hypothetical protein [Deferribacteraceae bacterium]